MGTEEGMSNTLLKVEGAGVFCLFSGLPDGKINPVSPGLGQGPGWASQNVGRRSQAGVGWQRRSRVVASASEVKSCSVASNSLWPHGYTVHGILRPECWSGLPFPSLPRSKKKTQPEKAEQTSEQDSDMTQMLEFADGGVKTIVINT